MNAVLSKPIKEVAEPLTVWDKFKTTRHELSRCLIERQTEINLALACLLAGEHLLLIGPPGTGKSLTFGGDTREATFEKAASQIQQARFKVEAYAGYLAEEQARLESLLNEAAEKLRSKVEGLMSV